MSNRDRPIIFCFRNDLRIADNIGLLSAAKSGAPVTCCYIRDDVSGGQWTAGGASRWWLHNSLASLEQSVDNIGGKLVFRAGPWVEKLVELQQETNAQAIYFSRAYEPYAAACEAALVNALDGYDVEVKRFKGALLFEPETVRSGSNEPFKVFTPFWKACLRLDEPNPPTGMPKDIKFSPPAVASDSLAEWNLLPTNPDWAAGLREMWTPGESGAWERLEEFVRDALGAYKDKRNIPGEKGTSQLSPHLHHGEISPRQVWHQVQALLAGNSNLHNGADCYLRELGWREFSYHLLHHWPNLPEQPFRKQFGMFPWQDDDAPLNAWQRGQTGIPMVDAGMRELWHTGWMHNRVRMVVASFLVKNLLIPWQRGEAWFWDTLVDADLANNAASWQWVAGSGADAAPYFRIFNPVTQGQKFDPDGRYVRRWIPELADLPNKYIHAPWTANDDVLKTANVSLGQDYPQPIVDLKSSRQRALGAFAAIKQNAQEKTA